MSALQSKLLIVATALAVAATLAVAPHALSALGGSGNVTDYVQLNVEKGALTSPLVASTAASSSGAIITSGTDAFNVTNSGSNVDTFIYYGWGTTPYYGASSGQTTINIRGATHRISDLLWVKQETLTSGFAATTSEYWSPVVVKSTDVAPVTFLSSGNACTGWANPPAGTFTAAGTFTMKYYTASTTNDAPSQTAPIHYCVDSANSRVYLNTAADFTGATTASLHTSDSSGGVLKTYQYEIRPAGITNGNKYCVIAINGAGTDATPELRQCQKMPYELAGVTSVRTYVLFDPPAFFPSVNQGGTVTFAVAGTQWNPYASGTTNPA